MKLRTAAFLALIGTILAAVLLVGNFLFDVVAAVRGVIPAVRIFTSLIYAFAAVALAIFFAVFYRQG